MLWIANATAQQRSSPTAQRLAVRVTLAGTVYDTLGQRVPGALVRVRRSATQVTSDSLGHFAVIVDAGNRVLEVSRDGFPALAMDVAVRRAVADTVDVFLFGALPAVRARVTQPTSARDAIASAAIAPAAPLVVLRRPGTIRGVITDTSGRPLLGAIVEVSAQQRVTISDSSGRFELTQLSPGAALVRVRRLGYAARTFPTNVSPVDAVIVDVPLLSNGQSLARVTVTSDALRRNAKLAGFFERKQSGFGQFITRDQFEARNLVRFTDIMNTMSGVVAALDGRGKRRIYGRGRCEMTIFLDGMNIIVPDGSSVDDFLDVYEIDAIEVHNRVTGLPPEFSGRTNACGVVAVWTKSRASR